MPLPSPDRSGEDGNERLDAEHSGVRSDESEAESALAACEQVQLQVTAKVEACEARLCEVGCSGSLQAGSSDGVSKTRKAPSEKRARVVGREGGECVAQRGLHFLFVPACDTLDAAKEALVGSS